jgi:hypothetical protein
MELSRIGAIWKKFYKPGHIPYSDSISLSTICRSPPSEFFLVSCDSEFVFVIPELKLSVMEHCLVGASLNKILRTSFCISRSLSGFRIGFQEMKQCLQSGVRIQGRKTVESLEKIILL